MVKREHFMPMLLVLTFAAPVTGCYTVIGSATGGAPATAARERVIVERAPVEERNGPVEEREDRYEVEEYDDYAYEDEYGAEDDRNTRHLGLKEEKYLRKYTQYEEEDGRTVINNYYYEYDEPAWYGSWYSRYWYDPWYWDSCMRPSWYVPRIHIGAVYDPWYWDDWRWNVGWSWGYYDPWYWRDPWYSYPVYSYHPWYRYSYYHDPWYYRYYDPWYYGGGGGGGNGGGDVVNGPRKIRPDRLAGFGTGRSSGGIETVGESSTEKPARGQADRGPTIRRDSRDGFGTVSGRRRSPVEVTTGKPANDTAGTTSARRSRNTESGNTSIHQRVRSGETARRQRSEADTQVNEIQKRARTDADRRVRIITRSGREIYSSDSGRETERMQRPAPESRTDNGSRRTRVWIRRESPSSSGYSGSTRRRSSGYGESREAPKSTPSRDSGSRRTESTERRRPSYNPPSVSRPAPSSSSGRSGGYSRPSTPRVSRPTPSYGGSSRRSSGGSSGSNSRPSNSRSGSRRR